MISYRSITSPGWWRTSGPPPTEEQPPGAGGGDGTVRREPYDDRGDVISRPSLDCGPDQLLGGVRRCRELALAERCRDVGDVGARYDVPQPVAAEHERVPLPQRLLRDLDLDHELGTEAPREHGARRVGRRLLGRDHAHAQHLADTRVVGGELRALALTDAVGAAVADV